jgi:acetoin utilization deacetylase AcuC-like enzyme
MTETKTTVRELIEKLKEFDQDTMVTLMGYEGGYSDVNLSAIVKIKIALNKNTSWYYGKHDEPEEGDIAVDAIVIG